MANYAKGPDFSHWNGHHDWQKFGASGASDFAIIKASEATTEDPLFRENWSGADGRMPRGAYHFFRPRVDPGAQARFFCSLLSGGPGELWPALDFEVLDGMSVQAAAIAAQNWNGHVRKAFGLKKLLFYSNYWLAEAVAKYLDQSTWELWLAWPVSDSLSAPWPVAPKGWSKKPILWQHTWQQGGLPGVGDQTVDFNFFYGTPEEMRSYFGAVGPGTPPLTLEQRVERLEAQAKLHGWKV